MPIAVLEHTGTVGPMTALTCSFTATGAVLPTVDSVLHANSEAIRPSMWKQYVSGGPME